MRKFDSCKQTINEVTREVFSRGRKVYDPTHQGTKVGKKDFDSMELVGFGYKLVRPENPEDAVDWARENFGKEHLTPEYGEDWFQEMLEGGLNPGTAHLKHRKEYWEKYGLDKEGKFAYTYSERMEGNLEKVLDNLRESPYRRAAYLPIWKDEDNDKVGRKRVPCSLGYHFLIRQEGLKDKLNLLYYQRSCDLANFYPLDLYRAVRMMQYVSNELNVGIGQLSHFISSLHCFRKDVPEERKW